MERRNEGGGGGDAIPRKEARGYYMYEEGRRINYEGGKGKRKQGVGTRFCGNSVPGKGR